VSFTESGICRQIVVTFSSIEEAKKSHVFSVHAMKAYMGSRGADPPLLTPALDGGEVST
jgi:hypothetical protein